MYLCFELFCLNWKQRGRIQKQQIRNFWSGYMAVTAYVDPYKDLTTHYSSDPLDPAHDCSVCDRNPIIVSCWTRPMTGGDERPTYWLCPHCHSFLPLWGACRAPNSPKAKLIEHFTGSQLHMMDVLHAAQKARLLRTRLEKKF
jgi:hypothetical protein